MSGMILNQRSPLRPCPNTCPNTPALSRTNHVQVPRNPTQIRTNHVQTRTNPNKPRTTNPDIPRNFEQFPGKIMPKSIQIYPNLDKSEQIRTSERPIFSPQRRIAGNTPEFAATNAESAS